MTTHNKTTSWKVLAISALTFAGAYLAPNVAYANKLDVAGTISVENMDEKDYPGLAKVTLADAIAAAQREIKDARPVHAELTEKDDFLVYKIKMVNADNRVAMVIVDAGNLTVLKSKQKDKKYD